MITDFIITCLITFGQALIGGVLILATASTGSMILNRIEDMICQHKARKAVSDEQ